MVMELFALSVMVGLGWGKRASERATRLELLAA